MVRYYANVIHYINGDWRMFTVQGSTCTSTRCLEAYLNCNLQILYLNYGPIKVLIKQYGNNMKLIVDLFSLLQVILQIARRIFLVFGMPPAESRVYGRPR